MNFFNLNFLRGVGNHHLEVARLAWFAGAMAGIVFAGVHLFRDHAFNIIEFGTGWGLLNAGSGAATAAKDIGVAKANATTGEAP